MRLDDILHGPLLEMSYSCQKAESVITGLEKSLNAHLLKLLCVGGADALHWRRETANWLTEVAEIRLRPTNQPVPAQFCFSILFDEPFGGVEEQNVGCRINRLRREGHTISVEINLTAVVDTLREFHRTFSDRCASGLLTDEEVERIVDTLAGECED